MYRKMGLDRGREGERERGEREKKKRERERDSKTPRHIISILAPNGFP